MSKKEIREECSCCGTSNIECTPQTQRFHQELVTTWLCDYCMLSFDTSSRVLMSVAAMMNHLECQLVTSARRSDLP